MSLIIPPVPLAVLIAAVDALEAVHAHDKKMGMTLPCDVWMKVRDARATLGYHTGIITKMVAVPVTPPADEKPVPAHEVLIGGGNLA